jgi:hypothetical protein
MVRKITFTGSTEGGCLLLARFARTIEKRSMEPVDNAFVMVFDAAELGAAADGVNLGPLIDAGRVAEVERHVDDAIAMANDTEFGQAVHLYRPDASFIRRSAACVESAAKARPSESTSTWRSSTSSGTAWIDGVVVLTTSAARCFARSRALRSWGCHEACAGRRAAPVAPPRSPGRITPG